MAAMSVGRGSDDPVEVDRIRDFMTSQWREPGFTCPNAGTYPWLWLWDSCFHSLIWAALGDPDRARTELTSALALQRSSGFVPHVVYYDGFSGHDDFWRTPGSSSITQPPIFGHSIAELERRGIAVPSPTRHRARHGFEFLFRVRRRTVGGLIEMVHPWESGCDHSPRWDDLFLDDRTAGSDGAGVDRYDPQRWYRRKGEMVAALDLVDGGAVSSDGFGTGSVAFNAMVAFCASELAAVTGDADLERMADRLGSALSERWDQRSSTWVDEGSTERGSGTVRTLEALLPVLIETRPSVIEDVFEQLLDPSSFLGGFGLRQVHPDEPTFDPGSYWRGASWPQLNYLFEVAARRKGRGEVAEAIAAVSRRGAVASDFSEYWNADDGSGAGARPQSWSGLLVVTTDIQSE